jgi:ketosteroid isomerase-like protein
MPGIAAVRSGSARTFAFVAVSLIATACAKAPSTSATADANAALLRRAVDEGWNAKNYATLPEIYASNYISNTNGVRDTLIGPAAVENAIKTNAAQTPDFTITVDEVFATADRVAMRWVWKGTDVPTGTPMQIAGTFVGRIEAGKLVEGWNNFDLLAAQLTTGATLTPAPPKK